LNGLSIQPEHAIINNRDNRKITLISQSAELLVNGRPMLHNTEIELNTNDRFVLSETNHFIVAKS
jgi:hypothetical protein